MEKKTQLRSHGTVDGGAVITVIMRNPFFFSSQINLHTYMQKYYIYKIACIHPGSHNNEHMHSHTQKTHLHTQQSLRSGSNYCIQSPCIH